MSSDSDSSSDCGEDLSGRLPQFDSEEMKFNPYRWDCYNISYNPLFTDMKLVRLNEVKIHELYLQNCRKRFKVKKNQKSQKIGFYCTLINHFSDFDKI